MESNKNDLSSLRIDRSEKKREAGSSKVILKTIGIILLAGLAILLAYTIYNSLFNPILEVRLTQAVLQSPSQSSASLIASGYVVAQRKAAVSSKATGRLIYLGVVEGDKVKQGEIIAKIEDSDVKAQLESAEANLELSQSGLTSAKNNFDRESALFKTGSASQSELDAASAQYKQVLASIDVAKANVDGAKVAVENTIIRAPFDGTVLTKDADIGEIVAPFGSINTKGAVVTIADMKSLQVEADVSESNIEKISPDQNCSIVLDAYSNFNYPGYVAKIVPTADRSKATVMVKVAFRKYDSKVLPEMSAKVIFLSDTNKVVLSNENQVLVVPQSDVLSKDGSQYVYSVKNNRVIEFPVVIGRQLGTYIEIKSGISNGEKIIDNVPDNIKSGIRVKIKE